MNFGKFLSHLYCQLKVGITAHKLVSCLSCWNAVESNAVQWEISIILNEIQCIANIFFTHTKYRHRWRDLLERWTSVSKEHPAAIQYLFLTGLLHIEPIFLLKFRRGPRCYLRNSRFPGAILLPVVGRLFHAFPPTNPGHLKNCPMHWNRLPAYLNCFLVLISSKIYVLNQNRAD